VKSEKKSLVIVLLLLLILSLLSACSKQDAPKLAYEKLPPYGQLPEKYTKEQAFADGCIVFDGLRIVSGQTAFDAFLTQSAAGQPSFLRYVLYTTAYEDFNQPKTVGFYHGAVSSGTNEYFNMFIYDLNFDGEFYILTLPGNIQSSSYAYLKSFDNNSEMAGKSTAYMLVNDADFTNEDFHAKIAENLPQEYGTSPTVDSSDFQLLWFLLGN
jgi:hypothetical protein